MALTLRGAGADVALVHHSDTGSQYTSNDYSQTLDDHGVQASIGTVGDAFDNAAAETFVDSVKSELIRDRVWRTRSQLELAVVEYVAWFNNERLHTSFGGLPSVEYEQQHTRIGCQTSPLIEVGNQSRTSPRNPGGLKRPGHRVTGDRSQRSRNWTSPQTRVGYDFAHAIVDDHSRLADVELHNNEKAATVTSFTERARVLRQARHPRQTADDRQRLQLPEEPLARRAARPTGHPPPHNRALPATHQRKGRALPPDDGVRVRLRARLPLTPRPNQALPHRLDHYNQRRPHSSLEDRPPISRVHNVRG